MIQINHKLVENQSSVHYVAPFAAFIILMALRGALSLETRSEYILRILAVAGVLVVTSWRAISWHPVRPIGSISIGFIVFAGWIVPDLIWPSYRDHWIFQNSLMGTVASSVPSAVRSDEIFIVFRVFGTVVLVPIIEELFWRGWLMRYAIQSDFQKVALGTYTALSFWFAAFLFASEHGPFWDVGLMAGVTYNWWILRTRNLSDCILAHATTNACLAVYVIAFGKWQYWL